MVVGLVRVALVKDEKMRVLRVCASRVHEVGISYTMTELVRLSRLC